MLKNVVQNKFVIWRLFLHHCQLQLKNVKNSKLVRHTLKSRTFIHLKNFKLKFFRSLVADEEQFAGSKVNIRKGVLENVAAALDPAFPELAEQTEEHRSIFQVCI